MPVPTPTSSACCPGRKPSRLDHLVLVIDKDATEELIEKMRQVGVHPAFVRLGHQITPFSPLEFEENLEPNRESIFHRRYHHPQREHQAAAFTPAHVPLERSDIALAKTPSPPFLECGGEYCDVQTR